MISTFSTNFYAGLHALVALATGSSSNAATSTTTKATSSSGSYFFLIFIFIIVGVYFLFIRPRSQAARRTQTMQQNYEIGDRVLTRAGIVGHVVGFVGDHIQLEIAHGVVIEVVKQAIGQKLAESMDDDELVPPPPGADDEDSDDHDADGDEDHDGSADDNGVWHTDDSASDEHDDDAADGDEDHHDEDDAADNVPTGGVTGSGNAESEGSKKSSTPFGRFGRSRK